MSIENSMYDSLVNKRKSCHECNSVDLVNPSYAIKNGISYDSNEIGPWTLWQGSKTAKILVIGQEWGTIQDLIDQEGKDSEDCPTNQNLIDLFNVIQMTVDTFDACAKDKNLQNEDLFFTNAILCTLAHDKVKRDKTWYRGCGRIFLKPLIDDMIKPKIVIALGEYAYHAVKTNYDITPKLEYREAVFRLEPLKLSVNKVLFVVPHPSDMNNVNTKHGYNFDCQKMIWLKIRLYLNENKIIKINHYDTALSDYLI